MLDTRKSLASLWLTLLASGTLPGCKPPSTDDRPRVMPELREQVGELPSSIRESSGVAVSRSQVGILWTHNDSGNENRLYAINQRGEVHQTFRVPGATNVDWEDIALGPCPEQTGECLYIADTGDNLRRRDSVSIYIVREPHVSPERQTDVRNTERATRIAFRYEDGPHDVEAMAVGPGGEILLVSKGQRRPIQTYSLMPDQLFTTELVLHPGDDAGLSELRGLETWVTGAAFSPTGDRIVVRTYTDLFFFKLAGGALVPEGDPCFFGAFEPVGEAIDFLDGRTLVMTSEALRRRPGPITLIRCPIGPA